MSSPRYFVIFLPGAEGGILSDFARYGSRQEAGLYFQHSSVANYVAEDGMDDFRFHAAFVACHYGLLSVGGQGDTGTSLDASMGPRLFSRGNDGHFLASLDIEKFAVFERFFNPRGVFAKCVCLRGSFRCLEAFRAPPGPPGTT
jgi:hypothetical protein